MISVSIQMTCSIAHRMLTLMRILKAITILICCILVSLMIFMSGVGDDGLRGMIIGFYGLGMAILAIIIELDVKLPVNFFGIPSRIQTPSFASLVYSCDTNAI